MKRDARVGARACRSPAENVVNHQHPQVNANLALIEAMKAEAAALEAQAAAKRAQAAALELTVGGTNDGDLLNVDQALQEYGFGRDALLNANRAGKLELVRGARNRITVQRSALEAYIKSRPVVRPRKAAPAEDLGDWEAQAERSLRAVKGGR